MAETTLDEWLKFLLDAGIRDTIALQYASNFYQNRIQLSMVLDLNRDILRDIGVTAVGDAIAILKHAKAYHEQSMHLRILKSVTSENCTRNLPGFGNRILPVIDTASISLNIRRNEGASTSRCMSPARNNYHSNATAVPGSNITLIKEDLSDMRPQTDNPLASALLGCDRSSEKCNSAAASPTNVHPNSIQSGYLPRQGPMVTSPSHNAPEVPLNTLQNRDAAGHSYGTHLVSRSQSNSQPLHSDQSRLNEISTKQENTSLGHIPTISNLNNRSLGNQIPVEQQSHVSNVSLPQQFSVRAMKRTHSNERDTQPSNYNLERNTPNEVSVEIPQRIKRYAVSPQEISQEQKQNETNVYASPLSTNSGKSYSCKCRNPTTIQSDRQDMNAVSRSDDCSHVHPNSSALKKGLFTAEQKRDRQSLSQLQGPLNSHRRLQMQRMSQMQEHPSSQLQQAVPKSHSRVQAAQSHTQPHSSSEQSHGSTLLQALSLEGSHLQGDTQEGQLQSGVTMKSNRPANFTVKVNGSGVGKIKKTAVKLQQTQPKTTFYSAELAGRKTQAGGTHHQVISSPSADYHNNMMVSNNVKGRRQNGLKTELCTDNTEMLEEVADTGLQDNGRSNDQDDYEEDIPATHDSTCGSEFGDVPSQIEDGLSMGMQHKVGNNSPSKRVPGQIFSRLGMKVESPSPGHFTKKTVAKNNALLESTIQRVVKINPKKLKITKQAQSRATVASRKLNQKPVVKKKTLRVLSQKNSKIQARCVVTGGASQRIHSGSQKKLKPRGILKPKTSKLEVSQEQPQRMTANLLLETVARSTTKVMDTVSNFQVDEDSFGSFPSETEEECFNYQAADDNTSLTDAEFSEVPVNSASGSKNVRFGPVCVKEFQKNIPPSSPVNGRPLAFRTLGRKQK